MAEISLDITPDSRFDVIDITSKLEGHSPDFLKEYNKALYCSYHTTAGYFEQSLCDRLEHDQDSLRAYINRFQELFPPLANYRHDQLHLRSELTEEQKENEPLNGDSHLTYIGSGLENCVTYRNRPNMPVYFVDLDGISEGIKRNRKTTIFGYNTEREVKTMPFSIPVSQHRIDSINLKDRRFGIYEMLDEQINRYGISKGRVDISLSPEEDHAAVTVNEYETLLMTHDLAEVLQNPMRFMAEKGLHMLRNPRAIPGKVLNYAKYDLVQIVNRSLDKFGLSSSLFGRGIQKVLASQASRSLRMKRAMSLFITQPDKKEQPCIVHGRYQSPILIQWQRKSTQTRQLVARLYRFE